MLVLACILVGMVLGTALVARSVSEVLGEVPKDRLGSDPWEATLGLERADPFQIAYLLTVDGATAATAVTVHGCVDPDGRPMRMPAWIAAEVS